MRGRIISVFLICLLVVGFFAQGFFVSTVFQWYLKGYCSQCLDGQLSYESLNHENGIWTLKQPIFISGPDLQEGGHHVRADFATITVNLSWLERRIDLNLALINPQIEVGIGAAELKRILNLPSQENSLFSIHSQLTIHKGSLFLSKAIADNSKAPIYFSVDLTSKETNAGCLSIWLNEQAYAKNIKNLEVIFSQLQSEASQVIIHANEVSCQELM
nr:hypothetical protein [Parachlamydiaceae bacterium]